MNKNHIMISILFRFYHLSICRHPEADNTLRKRVPTSRVIREACKSSRHIIGVERERYGSKMGV